LRPATVGQSSWCSSSSAGRFPRHVNIHQQQLFFPSSTIVIWECLTTFRINLCRAIISRLQSSRNYRMRGESAPAAS
jgi:hypothetical protein